jgi:HK97 gp10 family phage protein
VSSVTFKLDGLKDLDAALGQLPQSTGKNVLRRVGRAALQPVDDRWRELAPHLTGQLEESGSVGSKLSRRQRKAQERENYVEVFAGPGPNPQAIQGEFGNQHQAAQPFLRPAWDEKQGEVLQIVADQLGAEIQKAAARLARKAAKLAAKG